MYAHLQSSPGDETPDSPPTEYLYANQWRIWGVVMIGLFMALIDVTIVNISIPQLQRDLDALGGHGLVGAERLQHHVRGAARVDGTARGPVRPAPVLPARHDDLHGRVAALRAVVVGRRLIAFRVVQGVGAGILAPLALATTAMVFPPAQRGLGLAMMAVVANGAAALGPPIGGVLVEFAGWPWDAGWHWIFMINVPIGVARHRAGRACDAGDA